MISQLVVSLKVAAVPLSFGLILHTSENHINMHQNQKYVTQVLHFR